MFFGMIYSHANFESFVAPVTMNAICAFKIGFFFVLVGLSSCGTKSGSDIPIENFFSKPDKSDFQISPNGKFISYLKEYKGIRNLYVMDVDSKKTKRVTSERDIDIRSSFWADNEELIFFKERRSEENTSELQSLMSISYAVF